MVEIDVSTRWPNSAALDGPSGTHGCGDPFGIAAIPAFAHLPGDAVAQISTMLRVAHMGVGTLAVGAHDRWALLLLAQGRAETVCSEHHGRHPARRTVSASREPCVLAFLPGHRPGLHIRAHTPLTLLQVLRGDYEELARSQPATDRALRRATAHRLHR